MMNGCRGNTCGKACGNVLQQISLQFFRATIRPVLNAPITSHNELLHSRIHAAAAASSPELISSISSPPPPSNQQQQLISLEKQRVTQWFREYYSLGHSRARVHAKVERAAAALQAASPSRTVLSLEDDILSKAELLDALNPGFGWSVFARYPEEFAHPDAEDYWKIMAALLYTIGFEPAAISALFKRHLSLFAYTVRDPGNLKVLFEWMREIGLRQEDALKMVNKYPRLLQTNVQRRLIPLLAYIEDLGIERHQAVTILRRFPELMGVDCSVLSSRVTFLEAEVGLNREEVVKMIISQPQLLTVSPAERLAPTIAFLRDELGCEGTLLRRVIVRSGLLTRSTVTIRGRVKILAEFGIGPELLLQTMHNFPRVLLYTLESPKYQKKLEFFKRVMRGSPADLAANPQYVSYSLPDRIAPRVAAVLALQQPAGAPFYPISSLALKLEQFVVRYGMTVAEYHAFVEHWSASEDGTYWIS